MQDETIQFRTKESQSVQNLQEQANALHALKNQPPVVVPKIEPKVDATFRRPTPPPTPALVQAKLEQEVADREARERAGEGTSPESNVETPPSLYHHIHGETMLANVMGLELDNARTEEINNYILQKMRVGNLEDTKENYEKVLSRILAKNNLSMNQRKSYLVNKLSLYLYLGNDKLDDTDELVLSILNQRKKGRRSGIR